MSLVKYHVRDYTVRMHPQGKYYRVAEVDTVLEKSMRTQEQLAENVNLGLLEIRQLKAELAQLNEELTAAHAKIAAALAWIKETV